MMKDLDRTHYKIYISRMHHHWEREVCNANVNGTSLSFSSRTSARNIILAYFHRDIYPRRCICTLSSFYFYQNELNIYFYLKWKWNVHSNLLTELLCGGYVISNFISGSLLHIFVIIKNCTNTPDHKLRRVHFSPLFWASFERTRTLNSGKCILCFINVGTFGSEYIYRGVKRV